MEDNKPLVSIIVPIYNSENTIRKCVQSICEQTLKNIEVILINDGSIDNTLEVIEELKEKDKRIVIINKKNEGVSATRNFGIKIAKGEFIGFIDSDDYIDQSMYEKLYNKVNNENSDMGMCHFCVVNGNDKKEETWNVTLDKENLARSIFLNMIGVNNAESFNNSLPIMGSTCRCIYKSNIIKNYNISFHKEITYAEDLIFNLEYLSKIKKVSVVDEALYYYRKNNGSLSLGYRKNFYEEIKKLMRNIIRVCEDNNIALKSGHLWLGYLIEVLRNYTIDVKRIKIERIKEIKVVVMDKENKERLREIEYKNLNRKNKLFYSILYNNNMKLAFLFYIFRCIKNIFNINK